MAEWSLLTNHARVLLCIAHDPGVRLRDIAARVGVTERTAYGIVTDLTEAGYVVKQKDGRRNRYQIQAHLPLRRPLPTPDSRGLAAVGEVLALLTGVSVSVGAAGLSARDEGPVARWPTAASQEQAMTDAPSMAGKYVLVTGGTGGIGKATAPGSPRWAPGLASPAVIRAAPRLPRPISAPQRATTPWTSLPPACPPRRRCAVWPLRYLAPTRGWRC